MNKYRTLLVDPPWEQKMAGKYLTKHRRIRKIPYPTLNIEEIKKLPINNLAEEGCHLWLWTTNTHIRDAYELLEEWGFAPKTILTWDKINIGVGYWLRNKTEHCILAIKGSPIWDNKIWSTLISEKRTTHSTKPEIFYKMVDEICVGRKLDYFARKKRIGWDSFGDEIN